MTEEYLSTQLQTSTPKLRSCYCRWAPRTAVRTSAVFTHTCRDLLFPYQQRGVLGMKPVQVGVYRGIVLTTERYSSSTRAPEALRVDVHQAAPSLLLSMPGLPVQRLHAKSPCLTLPSNSGCVTQLGTLRAQRAQQHPGALHLLHGCHLHSSAAAPDAAQLSQMTAVAHLPQSTRATLLDGAKVPLCTELIIQQCPRPWSSRHLAETFTNQPGPGKLSHLDTTPQWLEDTDLDESVINER